MNIFLAIQISTGKRTQKVTFKRVPEPPQPKDLVSCGNKCVFVFSRHDRLLIMTNVFFERVFLVSDTGIFGKRKFELGMIFFSQCDTGILGKKFRVLPTGVEPTTFRLPVRTLYH